MPPRLPADMQTMRLRPNPARLKPLALFCLAAAVFVPPVHAADCPEVLAKARRLVLVTAADMNAPAARLQRFKRDALDSVWAADGEPEPAVVGQAGLGWGAGFLTSKQNGEPEKREGDRRTPAGFYPLGRSFGFEASRAAGYLELKAGQTVCVDDPKSPHYNTIQPRSVIGPRTSGEDMRLIPLYRSGLVIDYPSDGENRRGSCIFLHIWKGPQAGTLGCVAMPEPRVKAMQAFSREGDVVIGLLPAAALARFGACLPGIAAGE